MLGVRRKVVRRATTAAVAVALVSLPTTARASPEVPTQEQDQASDDEAPGQRAMVGLDSLSASTVDATLGELHAEITRQLELLGAAQAGVATANAALADADSALNDVRFRIEETTGASDAVVVEAFMNPPSSDAGGAHRGDDGGRHGQAGAAPHAGRRRRRAAQAYEDALADLAVLEDEQESALATAEAACSEAEAALEDLEAATGEQALFVSQVQAALAQAQTQVPTDPAEADGVHDPPRRDRRGHGAGQETREIAAAQAAIEAGQRRLRVGAMMCPVDGPVHFTDTWGAARSGGRSHQGVDMLAARGTPTVAPVSGEVQHRGPASAACRGTSTATTATCTTARTCRPTRTRASAGWRPAPSSATWATRATPAAHLTCHFEVHPGGGAAVNPYPYVVEACR